MISCKPRQKLKPFNTFNIDVNALQISIVYTIPELIQVWKKSHEENLPIICIGQGSNLLFLEDYIGTVIINRLKGIKITENSNTWHLHVSSGESWHALVQSTLKKGLFGLENLAFIPGCVGSAAVQNIGAYGLEFNDICEYVDLLNLTNQKILRMSASECQFKYRESIFQYGYKNHVIIAVGLLLKKNWAPKITTGFLKGFNPMNITAEKIFYKISDIRSKRLPNPITFGNAGSFFKNPIINSELATNLRLHFPEMIWYPQSNGKIKISASWLIEQCHLKESKKGGAGIYRKNPLVLINESNASGWDIAMLAYKIRKHVAKKFDIWLEPEVSFFSSHGKINPLDVIG
ncbi:MAG: UDP-N-acetylmuramate dehydrogenase [Candidatus Dasytiphilus stammeri]